MHVFVYVTAGSQEEAKRIGRTLVEERLAACINVLPMESVYRWQGNIEEASEAVLIVKTTEERVRDLERRIKELHSYTLPCIVWWRIEGNEEYLRWLSEGSMAVSEVRKALRNPDK